MSKPYTRILTHSLKGEGINGWTLISGNISRMLVTRKRC
jgi:hypothetical protein